MKETLIKETLEQIASDEVSQPRNLMPEILREVRQRQAQETPVRKPQARRLAWAIASILLLFVFATTTRNPSR